MRRGDSIRGQSSFLFVSGDLHASIGADACTSVLQGSYNIRASAPRGRHCPSHGCCPSRRCCCRFVVVVSLSLHLHNRCCIMPSLLRRRSGHRVVAVIVLAVVVSSQWSPCCRRCHRIVIAVVVRCCGVVVFPAVVVVLFVVVVLAALLSLPSSPSSHCPIVVVPSSPLSYLLSSICRWPDGVVWGVEIRPVRCYVVVESASAEHFHTPRSEEHVGKNPCRSRFRRCCCGRRFVAIVVLVVLHLASVWCLGVGRTLLGHRDCQISASMEAGEEAKGVEIPVGAPPLQ